MTLTVEDGSGVLAADSYVAVTDFASYCAAYGKDLTQTTEPGQEIALRRATRFIDNTYRQRFTGLRTNRRLQALEWPRVGSYYFYKAPPGPSPYPWYDIGYWDSFDAIPNNLIPAEVRNAVCEAAYREATNPGILLPDLDRDNAIRMVKAGSVAVQYADGAPMVTTFQEIDFALSALLMPESRFSGRVSRA